MSKGKGIFGGKEDEQEPGDVPTPAAAPAAAAATDGNTNPNARKPLERAPVEPPKDSEGRELNAGGKPVDESAPPLGDQDVTAPDPDRATPARPAAEREEWGENPSAKALEGAHLVEVRTRDPRLKRAYVAGVEVGREPRTISLDNLRALGKQGLSRVASLATDSSVDVRIVDKAEQADPANKPAS